MDPRSKKNQYSVNKQPYSYHPTGSRCSRPRRTWPPPRKGRCQQTPPGRTASVAPGRHMLPGPWAAHPWHCKKAAAEAGGEATRQGKEAIRLGCMCFHEDQNACDKDIPSRTQEEELYKAALRTRICFIGTWQNMHWMVTHSTGHRRMDVKESRSEHAIKGRGWYI